MKNCRLILIISILVLGITKLPASEYEKVRKAPRVHVPVWQAFALSDVELTDSYFKESRRQRQMCIRDSMYAVVWDYKEKALIMEVGKHMEDVATDIICRLVP